jgi:dihydrolipoamide dehydrogenase
MNTNIVTEVVILGGGPGGYTAAFRAADLGKQVILIERYSKLGGVCLNVGCIPSKALLHAAAVINDAVEITKFGVHFTKPSIDLEALRANKNQMIERIARGLSMLAKQRKVQILQGVGKFVDAHRIDVTADNAISYTITFDSAIIACGSKAARLPNLPNDPRIINATAALNLADIPAQMLIIGGGVIGLEMATVYQALGTQIDIVETQSQLIPGCDLDLVKVLHKKIDKRYRYIMTDTKVTNLVITEDDLQVQFAGKNAPETSLVYDKVLIAIGRIPNGQEIDADKAGVKVDERGFIHADHHQRTNVSHIYAVGDVVGNPMLAHKAVHEAKVAAESIAGLITCFEPLAIPAVAYTDPEIAWMGLTEQEAQLKNIKYDKAVFPWAASGRALGIGSEEGLTKLLFDPATKRILGAGIVGRNAGELISEAVLALELGANAEDLGLIIHPHPTLSETLGLAADIATGSITDILPPKRRLERKGK